MGDDGPAVGHDIGADQLRTYLDTASAAHRRPSRFGVVRVAIGIGAAILVGGGVVLTQIGTRMPVVELPGWVGPLASLVEPAATEQRTASETTLPRVPEPQNPALPLPVKGKERANPDVPETFSRQGDGNVVRRPPADIAAALDAVQKGQGQNGRALDSLRVGSPAVVVPSVALPATRIPAASQVASASADGSKAKGADDVASAESRNADAINVTVTEDAGSTDAAASTTAAQGPSSSGRASARRNTNQQTIDLPGEQAVSGSHGSQSDGTTTERAGVETKRKAGTSGRESAAREIQVPSTSGDGRAAGRALRAGQPKRAAQLFQQVLATQPKRVDAAFGLALARERLGAHEAARDAYRRVLDLDPGHTRALARLTELAAKGPPDKAVGRLQKLRQSYPEVGMVRARLALALARSGDLKSAAREMRRAVRLAPGKIRYRYDLAVLLDHTRKMDAAARAYRRVLEAHAAKLRDAGIEPAAVRRRLQQLNG